MASIVNDIKETMEAMSGLSEMIDAAIDMVDPDEDYNDMENSIVGTGDPEDDLEIDEAVGEDEEADVDIFLEKEEKDGPPEIFSDAKPLDENETGGPKIPSDDSGEIDPDVGEETVADVDEVVDQDKCLESMLNLLDEMLGSPVTESSSEEDKGTDILTGNDIEEDETEDMVPEDDDDEDNEIIDELDDDIDE